MRCGLYDSARRDLLELYDFGGALIRFEHIIDPVRGGAHAWVWFAYLVPCLYSVVELLWVPGDACCYSGQVVPVCRVMAH